MGAPRKRTRRIVVGGRAYRWRLLSPGYDREAWMTSPPRLLRSTLVLYSDECPSNGQPCRIPVSWTEGIAVTPEVVEKLIRLAVGEGWDPDGSGPARELLPVLLDDVETRSKVVRDVMSA